MSSGLVPLRYPGPLDYHDAEPESLREDTLPIALELPRADLHRNDGGEQPDQRRPLQAHGARYRTRPDEPGHWSVGHERQRTGSERSRSRVVRVDHWSIGCLRADRWVVDLQVDGPPLILPRTGSRLVVSWVGLITGLLCVATPFSRTSRAIMTSRSIPIHISMYIAFHALEYQPGSGLDNGRPRRHPDPH